MRKLTKTAAVVASMAVMAMGATVMTSAATEGWVQSGSNWYYYVKGDKVADQWVKAGDDWYFIDEEGRMVRNTFVRIDKYDGSSEVLNDDDIHSSLGQDDIDDDSEFYYLNADGTMATGWKEFKASNIYASPNSSKASNVWYYFGATGRMYINEWVESNGEWYALSANGQMYAEAVVNNDLVDWDDDDSFYMSKSGAWVRGWYKTTEKNNAGSAPEAAIEDGGEPDETDSVFFNKKDKWVYGNPDTGVLAQKEWKEINGKYYFFGLEAERDDKKDNNLTLATLRYNGEDIDKDEIRIDVGFTVSGSSASASKTVTQVELKAHQSNGNDEALRTFAMYSDKFVRWGNHDDEWEYFYLQKDGDALTSWKELDDDYWICGNDKGELYFDEIAKINGKYYYFDKNGICDEKYLNNTVDYVAIVDPENKLDDADRGKDKDDAWHISTGALDCCMYETSSDKGVYDSVVENKRLKIADMKETLKDQWNTDNPNGDKKDQHYYIDGRKVRISSMTDNEVILVYTAYTTNSWDIEIEVYKLRTSAMISGKVKKTK